MSSSLAPPPRQVLRPRPDPSGGLGHGSPLDGALRRLGGSQPPPDRGGAVRAPEPPIQGGNPRRRSRPRENHRDRHRAVPVLGRAQASDHCQRVKEHYVKGKNIMEKKRTAREKPPTTATAPPSASRPNSSRPPTSCAATWSPRLQARGAGAHLPQVHLRRLRGQAPGAAGRRPGRRRRPRRIPGRKRVLGAEEARWSHLQANAKQPTIGTLIDDAMRAIEKENESLKGVLPKDYARPRSTR